MQLQKYQELVRDELVYYENNNNNNNNCNNKKFCKLAFILSNVRTSIYYTYKERRMYGWMDRQTKFCLNFTAASLRISSILDKSGVLYFTLPLHVLSAISFFPTPVFVRMRFFEPKHIIGLVFTHCIPRHVKMNNFIFALRYFVQANCKIRCFMNSIHIALMGSYQAIEIYHSKSIMIIRF